MFTIENHRLTIDPLESKVEYIASGNVGGAFKTPDCLPDTIVLHYTGSGSVSSAVNALCSKTKNVSAHLVVGEQGEVVQLVDFDKVAWHAGASRHAGRTSLNNYSIGIEIVNPGWLEKRGATFLTWYNSSVSSDRVLKARHLNESTARYWHTYTEAQVDTVMMLCSCLMETYNIRHILGHDEIAPTRKIDPGPAFPTAHLRSALTEDRDQNAAPVIAKQQTGVVSASKLNFRRAPSLGAPTVTTAPLRNNTSVEILREEGGWLEVETRVRGWVKRDYIDKHS